MRVLAVEIRNHPGLGDFNIDFREKDGRAARLAVIAGENGCGKTAVLEAIFTALAPSFLLLNSPRRLAPGKYRILLETDSTSASIQFHSTSTPEPFLSVRKFWPGFNGIIIDVDGDEFQKGTSYNLYHRMSDNTTTQVGLNSTEIIGTTLGCFYSEATVNFEVPQVQTIRASASESPSEHAPINIRFPVRGGSALATEVVQLLFDLQAADDADVARWLSSLF